MGSNIKSISAVLDAPSPHMVGDGFKVSNFFPGGYKIKMSPFYLLDFNDKTELLPTNQLRGVGVHPHRGFETVTIAYHGAVAHHDSSGNSGVIYPGDVQWMTAASGILHKEYHEKEFSRKGGLFQMVQLWVNLPAKDKMSKPKYQAIKNDSIGKYVLQDNAGFVEVIAGAYGNITGAASTFSNLNVYNAHLNTGGEAEFSFPACFNTGILIVEGNLIINQEKASGNQFVYFKNDGEDIHVRASSDSTILILSGEPINEPIAQYGPFLMNTPEEIRLAISDYNEGRFGYLED
ncbi:short-chain dehydrogenase [Pedobacter lusitanus]|uniref:Short-chain dehydrogenase n=1 Tax=Pedobacter lusitanus TaxID=1503925 RepID=A0A0D0FU06_9SPHI|nr:pirin family protein [Pedobacter lusitanus]KIO75904.1 short-chain dehydrogenase [Pedobacter lusitanus]